MSTRTYINKIPSVKKKTEDGETVLSLMKEKWLQWQELIDG